MAGKKIGIVIAADGEKQYSQAVQSAKKESRLFETQLKGLEKQFEGNANSLEFLKKKQELLTKQQDAYQIRLESAQSGLKKANSNYKDQCKRLEELEKQLDDAKKAQKEMEDVGQEGTRAYEKQTKAVEDLEKAIEKQEIARTKESGSIADWNKQIYEAESALNNVNSDIDKNVQYMEEAKQASDKCAVSIDKMGNEVRDSADDFEDASEKTSTFGDVLKANLTSEAIIGGVKSLAGAAKEGAQALVDMATEAAAYADEILTASTVTGMSTEDLQAYSYAAELVDVSLDTLTKSMAKNIKSMDSARDGSESYAEAYEKLGVAVTDADGNLRNSEDVYWDVIDALGQMTDETEKDAISMQLFGKSAQELNPLIAQGSEGIKAFKEEAKEMGAVLSEDTLSSLGKTDDSLQRLNQQTEIFKRTVGANIAPVVEDVANAAIGVLDSLTKAIDPPKTAMEEFIDGIKSSNEEVQNLIDNASNTMAGAESDVANLEAYKQTLIELNEQESLTEFQKYQLADAVKKLGDSVPGLTEAFNEEKGTLILTNDELEDMFNNAEAIAMQTAIIKAQQDSYDALAQSVINKAKADSAAKTAMEDLTNAQEELYNAQKSGKTSNDELNEKIIELSETLSDAEEEQEKANLQQEEAQKQIDSQKKVLEGLAEQYGITTESIEENTDTNKENEKSVSDMGDAASEAEREFDALGREITGMSDDAKEAAKQAAQEIVDAYDGVKEGLKDSIEGSISLFDEFAEQTPITINDMINNLNSQIEAIAKWEENMTTLAEKIGSGMSQELYDSLVSLGPEQTAAAVQTLVDAAEGQADKFEEVSRLYEQKLNLEVNSETLANQTSAGKAYSSAVAKGISEGTIEAENASKETAQEVLEEFQKKEEEFKKSGTSAVELYKESLINGRSSVSSAAGSIGSVALNALNSYQNAFYNAGYNIPAGVASGIYDGQSRAINAATNMARQTLEAAKKELEIHSPSRKFRLEVGQNISESTAFGIDDKASLAGASASKMSSNVFKKATAWLAKYKKSHKLSLEDEQYFWKQIVKHTKDGTAAYAKAVSKLTTVNNNLIGSTLNASISNNFGVSWKEDNTASAFSDGNKSVGDYYSEYYNTAKKTLENYKVLHDMSLEQEIAYWEKVKKNITSGTDAWYSVTSTIKELKEDVVKRDEELNNAILDNAEKYIDRKKIIGDISTQQELSFWKKKLNQVEKNSDAYFEILEKINDLEEKKVEEQKERLQSLASTQDKILSDYKTYYKVSARAEAQYWNIARKQFSEGTQERIDADKKYFDALQEMYDQRKELDENYAERSKEINNELKESVQELQDAYHDAVSSRKQDILSSMNLFEAWDASGYDADTLINNLKTQVEGLALWEQQLEKLKERGISTDLYDYLLDQGPDAAANIYSIANATDEQLAEYQKLFRQRNELAQSQALKDNEGLLKDTNDNISRLQKDAQKELDALNTEYNNSVSKLTETISSDLKTLITNAKKTGEDAVAGLISGIDKKADSVEVYNSTTKVVKNVTSVLKILEDEGSKIGSGMLENILDQLQDSSKIETAAQEAVKSVKYAMEKAMSDEYNNLSYAGIAKLNRLLESEPKQNTVVNVDNSEMASAMQGMVDQINTIVEKIQNLQVVMYPDTIVGELQEKMSQKNAEVSVRKRRGNL